MGKWPFYFLSGNDKLDADLGKNRTTSLDTDPLCAQAGSILI